MTDLFPYLQVLFNTLCYLIPLFCFLPFKMKFLQKTGLFFILFVCLLLNTFYLGSAGVILLLIFSCGYIAVIHSDRLLNICIFIVSYLFLTLCDNIFSILWEMFVLHIFAKYNYIVLYIIGSLLYITFLCIICTGIAALVRHLLKGIRMDFSSRFLTPIAANLACCLVIYLFNLIVGEHIGYSLPAIAFNCFLFVCYFCISTILIISLVKSNITHMEHELQQSSYNALQSYTSHVENMYGTLRSFKHDYQNIMLSMAGYIDSGDFEGLTTYFHNEILPLNRQLEENTANVNQLLHIKNKALKSLLSAKLLYASELNIQVTIEIPDEIDTLPMDMVDLARILGILLDNAIEGALETDIPALTFAAISSSNVSPDTHTESLTSTSFDSHSVNPETRSTGTNMANVSKYTFVIANTFLDKGIPFATLNQPNVSSKGANRGIGLHTAAEIIQKYDSVFLNTEIKGEVFSQTLLIATRYNE